MSTSIDRYLASHQLLQQIADLQNNMRHDVVIFQQGYSNPTSDLYQNLPLIQTRIRLLGGNAFLPRINRLTTLVTDHLADIQAGTAALGVSWSDIVAMKDLLFTWATNLSTATITTEVQLNNSVAALLAAVPAAIQPY